MIVKQTLVRIGGRAAQGCLWAILGALGGLALAYVCFKWTGLLRLEVSDRSFQPMADVIGVAFALTIFITGGITGQKRAKGVSIPGDLGRGVREDGVVDSRLHLHGQPLSPPARDPGAEPERGHAMGAGNLRKPL